MSVERFGPPAALRGDTLLLFVTRFIRLFAYGALSVVLVIYLTGLGLRESQVGLLLTLTLLGDTVVSLLLTTQADRIGRRRILIIGRCSHGVCWPGIHLHLQLPVPGDRRHSRRH